MQTGDVYTLDDGSHVLVLRLNVARGKHLFRVWHAGCKKAQPDIMIGRQTLKFYNAVLVGKNCRLNSQRRGRYLAQR
jgi:hypothetical protein